MDAIEGIGNAVHRAEAYSRRSCRVVLLKTINFINVFNSVRWVDIPECTRKFYSCAGLPRFKIGELL